MKTATLAQGLKVLELIKQKEVSAAHLQRLLAEGFLADLLEAVSKDGFTGLHRDTVREALDLSIFTPDPVITELGELVVSDKLTIKEMIQAGEYDGNKHNTDLVCQHFSITRRGPRNLYLVHFKKDMDSKRVERSVAAMADKELALVEDLLAVGAHPKHKELRREFPIICLGSSAKLGGHRYVPCLSRSSTMRLLELIYYGYGWHDEYRFLLADKVA